MRIKIVSGTMFWLLAASLALAQGHSCANGNYCSGPETAAQDAVSLPLANGSAAIVVNLNGTFSATVTFEGGVNTPDGGITWVAASGTPVGGGSAVTTATGTGQWRFVASGFTNFRVRCSAYTSGRIYATISASPGSAASGGSGSGSGTVSGQANGVIPLATGATTIGAQSHIADSGSLLTLSESITIGANTLTIPSGGTLTCAAGSTCPAGIIPVQTSSTPSVLYSGSYTSGITATGTTNQTCALSSFNNGGSGATATVALSSSNTVSAGTPIVVTAIGSGFTSAPTSATAGNGTATCSGTATVATIIAAPVADPGGISYAQYCGTTGCIFTTPAGASGYQRIYRNATTDFGVITVQLPASNTADLGGVNTSSAGCLQSSGALGDAIYIFSDTTNHWYAYPQGGTWSIQSGNTCN